MKLFAMRIPKDLRNQVLLLSSGVFLANIVSFVFMPVLTRLYTPSEFGIFAIYSAIANIVGGFSALRLELAIPLPGQDEESRLLTSLTLGLVAVNSVFAALFIIVVFLIFPQISIPKTYEFWGPTIISFVLIGGNNIAAQVSVRRESFKTLSLRHIGDRGAAITISVILALAGFHQYGLIWAQTAGLGTTLFILTAGNWKWFCTLRLVRPFEVRNLFSRYRDFPLFNSLSTGLQLSVSQLPFLIYGAFFPAREIGLLALAQRLFDSPCTLISSSLTTVYYRRLLDMTKDRIKIHFNNTLWRSMVLTIAAISIALLGARYAMGPLFGKKWADAYYYLLLLSPLYAMRIPYSFQQNIFLLFRRLDLDFTISLLLCVIILGGILIGVYTGTTLHMPVGLGAAAGAVGYFVALTILRYTVNLAK